MIRLLLALTLALGCGAASAWADEILTEDRLIELVLSRDIDAVEAGMIATQAAAMAGDVDLERTRVARTVFGAYSPDIVSFVAEWGARHPGSAHALAAQGWVLYHAAFAVRGTEMVRWTSPESLELFKLLSAASADRAEAAYRIDPDLLSASDLMLFATASGYTSHDHEDVIDRVMTVQPNASSLIRAFRASDRRWGGSPRYGQRLCNTYGDRIPAWGPDAVDVCKLTLSAQVQGYQPRDWFLSTAAGIAPEYLQHVMIEAAIREISDDPYWIAAANDWFSEPDVTDMELALRWDEGIGVELRLTPASRQVHPRAVAAAEARLAWDPYNLDAIAVLNSSISYESEDPTEFGFRMNRGPELRARREELLLFRQQVQPYVGEAWADLRDVFRWDANASAFSGKVTDALLKAVYFSNYKPEYLSSLYGHTSDIWETEGDHDAGCLAGRALLLGEAICAERGVRTAVCTYLADDRARRVQLIADVEAVGQCPVSLNGSIRSLLIAPQELSPAISDPIEGLSLDLLLTK